MKNIWWKKCDLTTKNVFPQHDFKIKHNLKATSCVTDLTAQDALTRLTID